MKTAALEPPVAPLPRSLTMADFAELVKARLTFLVLITTAVGFYIASDRPINFLALAHAVFGTALAAAGAAALNQWWEHRLDAAMLRTRDRPIPAGRMTPRFVAIIGAALAFAGVVYLALAVNGLSAFLAALTVALYVFAYTPLKKISTANTLVGAIPGALPPLIGWVAARGVLDTEAWSLFAIMFVWQMPHFFALAWMYREDYARAGFRMMSQGDADGLRSSSQSVLFCILLLIIAGVPSYIGLTTALYLPLALTLSGWFVAMAMRFHHERTAPRARALFLTSITYLPLLFAALCLTKR
ncbi:MAG: protoheme IX farnesyltransferase [Chthoniobacterales bacterium]|nr:protoheme IX farnesyltransferase [Chthoniobacterales bacterium]